MTRKTKWYHTWWFYTIIILLLIIIIGAYFSGKKVLDDMSVRKHLETKLEVSEKTNLKLDSLYRVTSAQKDKIRIIKEKIDITEDIKKLQSLIDEYDKIKKDSISSTKPTSKELLNYINKEF